MSRLSPLELVNIRLKNQIEDQSKTIASLERRIDALKTIIAEICERHEIPLPDLRFSHYVPRSVSTTHEKGCSVVEKSEKPESELMGKLIGEMIVNRVPRKSAKITFFSLKTLIN